MIEDKLQPIERVRLEALAQAIALNSTSYPRRDTSGTDAVLADAARFEKWILEGAR